VWKRLFEQSLNEGQACTGDDESGELLIGDQMREKIGTQCDGSPVLQEGTQVGKVTICG